MLNSETMTAEKVITKTRGLVHLSYETASSLFNLANAFLVLALFVGVVATYVIYATGNIKEDYVKEKLAESHERSAKLEQEAAKANERAATLEREAAELKLELVRRTQPLVARTISPEQAKILKSVFAGRSLSVGLMWPTTEREVDTYAKQLRAALLSAGVHIAIEGGANTVICSGGETLMGDGVSLVGGTDAARQIIIDAFSRTGIPLKFDAAPIGIVFGVPMIVVGSCTPLPR